MSQQASGTAVIIFGLFVLSVLALSFYLGRRGQTAKGYFAAHGQIHWAVNGIAFAGDYLSAASFLGICGLIAFYGYDGFLYSIGYLAGWIVALFVVAEPIRRLGKFTFADAMDSKFQSRGIKLVVAIATLVVSVFYLIPQMVGAGTLITPLLGLPHYAGVLIVGVTVTLIVVTAGMVSTTWVQFIKGSLLVVFCGILTVMILNRGLSSSPAPQPLTAGDPALGELEHPWAGKPFARSTMPDGRVRYFKETDKGLVEGFAGKPSGLVGTIARLPGGQEKTGPVGPLQFLRTIAGSDIVAWPSEALTDANGTLTKVFYPVVKPGSSVLTPGAYFKGMTSNRLRDKLDFISLMLALFLGTASLPHILIRYYTVKDQAAARKSTVVGIAAIGAFYVLTLYLGLGAMVSGALDPRDSNMSAPLLARTFSEPFFAVLSAIAFTTVLGTVAGLIMAGAGAVAHDLCKSVMQLEVSDEQSVRLGKIASVFLGIFAMVLGIIFKDFNVSFLVGWAFNIAASANLPALVMLLFWSGTTKQGIIAAVTVGMVSSLGWVLLSAETFEKVYHVDRALSPMPFSQPGLVTIPLGFVTLVVVSLLTRPKTSL